MSLLESITTAKQTGGQRFKVVQVLSREQRDELDDLLKELDALSPDCQYTWAQITRGVNREYNLKGDKALNPPSLRAYAERELGDG